MKMRTFNNFNLSTTKSPALTPPYGGKVVDLRVPTESYAEIKAYASQLPSIQVSPRAACDLELLATGALSPLDRFMGQDDYQRVLDEMRLADGHIFPIPITLAINANADIHLDQDVALRNNEYELIAIMTIEEIYEWDNTEFAEKVLGTQNIRHPLVAELHSWGARNISGRLQVLNLPRHFDFQEFWLTPTQTRTRLSSMEHSSVVAFQPHTSWQTIATGLNGETLVNEGEALLLQPAVGLTKLGDIEHYTRIRIYRTLAKRHPQPGQVLLSLLPLATRLAGPREALWQALIRRNYGANHMIVSRDHASPINLLEETHLYGPEAAQELVEKFSRELGVKMIPESEQHKKKSNLSVRPATSPKHNPSKKNENSKDGNKPSNLFNTLSEVEEILAEIYLPRHYQGVCIWFTGLSGSGKSTTAEMLTWLLMEHGRRVTVLDGDVIRTHLSKGLGFSKEDRDINVRRIGFVASELVRLGGVVICAVVSPYQAARNDVRNMIGNDQFVEVFVDTPLQECEARDVKGFYAKARRGEIKGFTGIDDPYEHPDRPEIVLDTIDNSPHDNANFIINHLVERGFVLDEQRQN